MPTGNSDTTETDRDDRSLSARPRAARRPRSGDLTATANGTLVQAAGRQCGHHVPRRREHRQPRHRSRQSAGSSPRNSLARTTGNAAVNVDLPISRRDRDFSALGNLTLSANAEVDQLSDFGTLTKFGAGANWSPVDRLNFVTSWTREEGPPTINQLGDPLLDDARRRASSTSRPARRCWSTDAHRRQSEPAGGPAATCSSSAATGSRAPKTDLTACAPIMSTRRSTGRSRASTVTPQIEAAFPTASSLRGCGRLHAGQLRQRRPAPGQFRQLRSAIRCALGFDFSQAAQVAAAVAGGDRPDARSSSGSAPRRGDRLKRRRTAQAQQAQGRKQPPPAPPEGGGAPAPAARLRAAAALAAAAAVAAVGGFVRRDGNRGRLTFSLTDTITFVDKVTIAPGLPELDYLHGDAAGQTGGTPRHTVQAQAGYFNNGLGARIGANWRSGTDGEHAHRRRSPLLAAGDVRPQAVRQSRRHSGSRRQASVAARRRRCVSR